MRYLIATVCLLAMIPGGVLAQQSGRQTAAPKAAAQQEAPKRAHRAPAKAGPKPLTRKSHLRKNRHLARKMKLPAKAAVEPKPSAAIPAPAVPTPPPTLMHQPPVPAVVTMHDGQLTIDAPNCTLSEVLGGVGRATGASVEGITASQRVAVRLGPGNPRQVIAALLEGTPYNYIIIGSQQNPGAVTRIVLSQAASGPEPNPPTPPPQAAYRPQPIEPPAYPVPPGGIINGAVIQRPRPVQPQQPQPPANSPEQLFQQLLHPQPRQPLAPK